MGWPMAANLRRKIGKDRDLVICDVSAEAISRFQSEMSEHGAIRVVSNGYEAAEAAVSLPNRHALFPTLRPRGGAGLM